MPEMLRDKLLQLYSSYRAAHGAPPALRPWCRYATSVVEDVASAGATATESEVASAVGAHLAALSLFPDEQLFDEPAAAAVDRRVSHNFVVSTFLRPNGASLTDSDLFKLIDQVVLVDAEEVELDPGDAEDHRDQMRALVDGDDGARATIPFPIWIQLFRRKSAGGLGQRIRDYLEHHASHRVDEYIHLDIAGPLDDRDRIAAQQLIDHVGPPDESASLYGLLSSSLRRAVDRIAAATETVRDPLVALLRRVADSELNAVEAVQLSVAEDEEEGRFSRSLFGLLYGPTLLSVAAATEGGAGARLEISRSVVSVDRLSEPQQAPTGEEAEVSRSTTGWEPLTLRVHFDNELIATLLWDPERSSLVSFGRLLLEKSGVGPISVDSLERLELIASDPSSELPACEPSGSVSSSLAERRETFLAEVRISGLSAPAIHQYCDAYLSELQRAHSEYAPAGAPIGELDDLLEMDTAHLSGGGTAVLALHPLRLRWFARHLEESADAIGSALTDELLLNEENEQLYFDWLTRVSPHRQPPFLSARSGQFSISTREIGMHEEYTPLRSSGAGKNEWGGSVDEESIALIGRVVLRYLDEFPHAVDGLAVLVIDPAGETQLTVGLIDQIRGRAHPDLVLHLHVAAPKKHHSAIAAAVAELDDDSDRATRLLPRLQLMLHEWSSERSIGDLRGLVDVIDLCIAPDLFGAEVVVNTHASGSTPTAGAFDPWLDDPVRTVENAQSGVAVVRHLLPATPDPLLEYWSSLNVRRKTNQPVGGLDDLDYLSMTVQFYEHLELFEELHKIGHWVVTLDRFVGRQQFDASASRPDIIQVLEGVGKTDAYTLIVSSSSGRQFVADRFGRRLEHDFELYPDGATARAAADRLYDVGRNLVPGTMLRALGLGRTAEEVLGLVVARWRLSESDPVDERSTEMWLGLDDLTGWFGGFHKLRADMLRISVEHSSDGWDELTLDVIESKFRQTDDIGTAVEQVEATIRLLEEAFQEDAHADRRFWLRELGSAVSQTAAGASPTEDLPAYRGGSDGPTKRELVLAIEAGKVRLKAVRGFVCATNSSSVSEDETGELSDRIAILRTRRPGLKRILDHLVARDTPVPVAPEAVVAEEGDASEPYEPGPVSSPTAWPSERSEQGAPPPTDARGMAPSELDAAYQVALNVFSAHRVDVDRPDRLPIHEQGPGFYLMRFKPGAGTASSALTARSTELKLGLELARDDEVRSYVDRGAVVFEIPKSPSQRYGVDAASMWNRAQWPLGHLYSPLGEDISGEIVGIDFSSSTTPHLLIAGTTGSGKSVALETILLGLCRDKSADELRLHLVDPKGTELAQFEDYEHLEGSIGFDADDAIDVLDALVDEMQTAVPKLQGGSGSFTQRVQRRGPRERCRVPPMAGSGSRRVRRSDRGPGRTQGD